MTNEQKKQVEALLLNSMSYGQIAKTVGVSRDSVKAYCRYRNLQPKGLNCFEFCLQCGKKLEQIEGRKKRKFCSDACRTEWWNHHRDEIQNKEKNRKTCEFCGKEYFSNKASSRFCSCKCFADYRRSGGKKNDGEASQNSTGDEVKTAENAEADDEGTDSSGKGFPHLQSHSLCDECPWFILGQRLAEINETLVKAIQTDCGKSVDKEK